MKIIDLVKASIVRRLSIASPEGWQSQGQTADAGEVVTESSVMALSAVWACANLLSGTISSLPLMVYRTVDGVRTVDRAHPLYRMLHNSPNFDQTAVDFWQFMQASLEFWGNAYAQKVKTNGIVTALIPVSPKLMTVERATSGQIRYTWTFDGQNYEESDVNMLHIRGFGGNPLGGMSTLHFGRNAFGLARATDRAAGSTFKNGLRPSGALTFDAFLSAENREIAETKLVEKYVGSINAGRPLVLEGGTKWQQLTINPEDAQMLESRRFSVEEICRFFGVPPHMVGHTENSTSWGTGLEQQTLGFQKFTLGPRVRRIEQALSKQLLTPQDRANGVTIEFSVEGLLRGDSAGRASYYQTMTQIGAMTINEIRALENLPPVEGGNVVRLQMQNVPITQADGEDDDDDV